MGLLEDGVAVVTGGTSASGAPAPYSGRARVPGSHSRGRTHGVAQQKAKRSWRRLRPQAYLRSSSRRTS